MSDANLLCAHGRPIALHEAAEKILGDLDTGCGCCSGPTDNLALLEQAFAEWAAQ